MKAIAPVLSLPFYVRGEPPFEKALAAVQALGERLALQEKAAAVLAGIATRDRGLPACSAPLPSRPTYLVNIGDARHVRVFGFDSMFGDVLARLGLGNAWTDRSRFTFAAPVPIENLAADKDARIVVDLGYPGRGSQRPQEQHHLEFAAAGSRRPGRSCSTTSIPMAASRAGMRFARLLTQGLLAQGHGK